jgi:hypothetical protein
MLLLTVVFGCKKDKDDTYFPSEIATVINKLTLSFDTLNKDMAANVTWMSQNINDTAGIRTHLLSLYNNNSFPLEFGFVTPAGIFQIVEPALYHSAQGANLSQQDHIIKCFSTKLPVLSNTFDAVEGFSAAVDIHPIVYNNQILGGVTSLFITTTILDRIISPIVKNQNFEIWVMETNGRTIYDQDTAEVGLNVFTDPLYQSFPELISAAHEIANGKSGETSYSFYKTGTTTKVTKKTYWDTFYLYGNEWKIIWVKAE